MSGSLNEVNLIGNVCKDPEIRRTQAGKPIANLTVATNETWRDANTGERKEKSEFHRVVIFNEGLCGVVEKYVKKGSKLFVRGSLQTRRWQDQQGQDRYSTEVVLHGFNGQLTMLDGPNKNGRDDHEDEPASPSQAGKSIGGGGMQKPFDDEIPFGPEVR